MSPGIITGVVRSPTISTTIPERWAHWKKSNACSVIIRVIDCLQFLKRKENWMPFFLYLQHLQCTHKNLIDNHFSFVKRKKSYFPLWQRKVLYNKNKSGVAHGWSVLLHPSYSPDPGQIDYWLWLWKRYIIKIRLKNIHPAKLTKLSPSNNKTQ